MEATPLRIERRKKTPVYHKLVEVVRLMAETFELEPLLESIEKAAMHLLPCQSARILQYDAQADQFFRLPPYTGFGFKLDPPVGGTDQLRISARSGISGRAALTQRVVVVPGDPDGAQALAVPLTTPNGELMGLLQVLGHPNARFESADTELALVLGALAAIAIRREHLRSHADEKQRLEREIALAREVAQISLPVPPPSIPGYEVAGIFRPAQSVGGDFYDLVRNPQAMDFLIADASGHGLGAALIVSRFSSYFRALATQQLLPAQLARHVNHLLYTDLSIEGPHTSSDTVLSGERFVAACLGRIEPEVSRVTWLRAGLVAPLLLRAGSTHAEFKEDGGGPPFGILPDLTLDECHVDLHAGDLILFVTDGLLEWRGPSGRGYSEERLQEALIGCRDLPAAELLERIYQDAARSAQGRPQQDDLTLLAIRRTAVDGDKALKDAC